MARKPDMARRADIAARAFEVIRARGVHRTTMSDIATALEMKRPTLYWYFKNVGEIFHEVVGLTDARLREYVGGRLAGIDHPIDHLTELVEATIDFYEGRRDVMIGLFQLWAVSGSDEPERILQRSREFIEPVRSVLVDRLRAGMRDGLVADCDPQSVVDLAFAVVDGAQVQRVTRDLDPAPMVKGLKTYVLGPLRLGPKTKNEPGDVP